MPLRVNLLAENLAAEEQRRRDPLKRVFLVGCLLVLIMVVWSGYLKLKQNLSDRDLKQVAADITSHADEYSKLQADQKRFDDMKSHLTALENLSTNRFLQANLMNALQQVSVPGVQLARLKLTQVYVQSEGKKAEPGKSVGMPPTSTEKIVLMLDLKDSSSNLGDGVNKYKDALTVQPYFQSMLDSTNGVRLSGLTGVQTSTDGKQFEIFTLECHFRDVVR